MIGKKFSRLTVVSQAYKHFSPSGRSENKVDVVCDCGKKKSVYVSHLVKGNTRSCGCFRSELTSERNERHKDYGSPEYVTWCAIKQRCLNPKNRKYPKYGGSGISICDKWKESYDAFLCDVGRKPKDCSSLDRIDNSRNYEPGNVRWADSKTQVRNREVTQFVLVEGKFISVAELSEQSVVEYYNFHKRLRLGWSLQDALTIPKYGKRQCFTGPVRMYRLEETY